MSRLEVGCAYWLGNRTVIVGQVGRTVAHCVTIEADGLHHTRVAASAPLQPCNYKGERYPKRKARGHVRKATAVTETAKRLKKLILENKS